MQWTGEQRPGQKGPVEYPPPTLGRWMRALVLQTGCSARRGGRLACRREVSQRRVMLRELRRAGRSRHERMASASHMLSIHIMY